MIFKLHKKNITLSPKHLNLSTQKSFYVHS